MISASSGGRLFLCGLHVPFLRKVEENLDLVSSCFIRDLSQIPVGAILPVHSPRKAQILHSQGASPF